MIPRLCRYLRVRGRWRPCVVLFVYYLFTVLLIENILIATVHRRTALVDDYDADTHYINNTSRAEFREKVQVPTATTSTTVTHSSSTALPVTLAPANRVVLLRAMLPSTTPQEDLFYRRRAHSVNRYLHRVLLEPTRLCPPNTRMIILIHSHHPHRERRAAIRSTWGEAVRTGSWPNDRRNGSCAGLRLAFVFGLHRDPGLNDLIAEESSQHDDVVQGDFADSYQNMTLKSLLGLKIVDERCPGVPYLLKTDDDMIVNLPYLLDLLDHTHANLSRSIMGPLNIGSRVYRHGKWKLTKTQFPFDHFPLYESGSAYVITGDLIHELFVTSEYVPHISIDDVYVTGILGRILGVTHIRQRGFAFWTDKPPTDCDMVLNRVVTGTKMTPPNLRTLWNRLKLDPKCSVNTAFRISESCKNKHNNNKKKKN